MKFTLLRFLAPVLLAVTAGAAHAQYVWLDAHGVKQYSDMPPPVDVPASRILKAPGGSFTFRNSDDAPAAEEGKDDKQPPTLADKNADFQKRQKEKAEKEKKEKEEAKKKADKAADCEKLRGYEQALRNGERIASTDKNGERTFLSDEQRAREARQAREDLKNCK